MQLLQKGVYNFYIIDIRSTQSFRANHIPNSINLQQKDEIMALMDSILKPVVLVCFSASGVRKMAESVGKLTSTPLYYLDCGIMELADKINNIIITPPPQKTYKSTTSY